MSEVLRFIIPSGSLADQTRRFLSQAGYTVHQPDRRGYCGETNGVQFFQLDRRMIPAFIESRSFDAGIIGKDLLLNSGITSMKEICELRFSRDSERPTRWVLAQKKGFYLSTNRELRIGCELPHFAQILLKELHYAHRIVRISGSEEQCVAHEVIDQVLVVTESGSSISANELEIVAGFENLFESVPVIIQSCDTALSQVKEEKLLHLSVALRSVVGSQDYRLVTCDVPTNVSIQDLKLPASVAPTISNLTDPAWCAISICISTRDLGMVLAQLQDMGAKAIITTKVEGYIP